MMPSIAALGVIEAARRGVGVGEHRRQLHRAALDDGFERVATGLEKLVAQVAAFGSEAIEGDQLRRGLTRQFCDTARRRVQPCLQRVERQRAVLLNDEFAVDNEVVRGYRADLLGDLGEEARQRLARFRHQLDCTARLVSEAAEAVPLRLELPAAAFRQGIGSARLHRRGPGRQRERAHPGYSSACRAVS